MTAIIIAVVAAVLSRWLRKAVTALINRVTSPPALAMGALGAMGVAPEVDARARTRAETLSAVARASVSAFIWTIATLLILGVFN